MLQKLLGACQYEPFLQMKRLQCITQHLLNICYLIKVCVPCTHVLLGEITKFKLQLQLQFLSVNFQYFKNFIMKLTTRNGHEFWPAKKTWIPVSQMIITKEEELFMLALGLQGFTLIQNAVHSCIAWCSFFISCGNWRNCQLSTKSWHWGEWKSHSKLTLRYNWECCNWLQQSCWIVLFRS